MANELWLYGVIGPGYEVTAPGVRGELAKLNRRERLLVRINSPGGDVFEAVANRQILSEWPGGVDVQVDGLAASARPTSPPWAPS